MIKPSGMFDRDYEWSELSRFATFAGPHPALGVVSGRRRPGQDLPPGRDLRSGRRVLFRGHGSHRGRIAPPVRHGPRAFPRRTRTTPLRQLGRGNRNDHVARLRRHPLPVVLDEFPYLAKASPELPSLVQRAMDPSGRRRATPIRLLLCGSAVSFMSKLLVGSATAARPSQPRTHRSHTRIPAGARVLGHHRPTAGAAGERGSRRNARLPPGIHARRRSGRPERLRSLGRSQCAQPRQTTVPRGAFPSRRGARATRFGAVSRGVVGHRGRQQHARRHGKFPRPQIDRPQPCSDRARRGRHDRRDQDAFHAKRSSYRINEPLLAFYYAIMRPEWSDLERPGHAEEVWSRSQASFHSQVLGPHLAQMSRLWSRWHASPETLGGRRTRVLPGVLPDPAGKTGHQLDVVVFGRDGDSEQILAVESARPARSSAMGTCIGSSASGSCSSAGTSEHPNTPNCCCSPEQTSPRNCARPPPSAGMSNSSI